MKYHFTCIHSTDKSFSANVYSFPDTQRWRQPPISTSSTWPWQMLWSPPLCPSRALTTCLTHGLSVKWSVRSSFQLITTTCSPVYSLSPWWVWTGMWQCATLWRPWISERPWRPRSSTSSSGCSPQPQASQPWFWAALRPIMVATIFTLHTHLCTTILFNAFNA